MVTGGSPPWKPPLGIPSHETSRLDGASRDNLRKPIIIRCPQATCIQVVSPDFHLDRTSSPRRGGGRGEVTKAMCVWGDVLQGGSGSPVAGTRSWNISLTCAVGLPTSFFRELLLFRTLNKQCAGSCRAAM
jgi:hypothetical protein